MKNLNYKSLLSVTGFFMLALVACKDDKIEEGPITAPVVVTDLVDEVTSGTAKIYGGITSVGGDRIMGAARILVSGFAYGTNPEPTIDDNKTTGGPTHGDYSEKLAGLQPTTTYYVRAYATNVMGTSYGETLSFTTEEKIEIPVDPGQSGGSFEDDFNRDELGSEWNVVSGNPSLENGSLKLNNGLMAFQGNGAELSGGGENEWSFTVDVHNDPGENRFAGVAFNMQEGGAGFYLIRLQQYHGDDGPGATLVQVLKAGSGGVDDWLLDDLFASTLITPDGVYPADFRITVSSTQPGNFHVIFADPLTGDSFKELDLTDSGVPHTGGYAGIWAGDYSGDGNTYFDNFLLQIAGGGTDFSDNFERSDLGENWSDPAGAFSIQDGRAFSQGNSILLYQAPGSGLDANAHPYTFIVDVEIGPGGNAFGGVVFNYKEDVGFYELRTAQNNNDDAPGATLAQLLKFDSGGNLLVPDENNPGLFFSDILTPAGVYISKYRLQVACPGPGKFVIQFQDPDTHAVLVEQTFQDEGIPYMNGFVGFYSGNFSGDGTNYWDNFSLKME